MACRYHIGLTSLEFGSQAGNRLEIVLAGVQKLNLLEPISSKLADIKRAFTFNSQLG